MHRVAVGPLLVLAMVACSSGSALPPATPSGPTASDAATAPSGSPTGTGSLASAGGSTAVAASSRPRRRGLRFVALGDSYTIGTAVRMRERWPNQLVRALRPDIQLTLSANLGRAGATSEDVVVEQLPQLQTLRPHVVSLLVGVNDVVAGVPPEDYRANVRTILDTIIERLPADHVFVVTTPDYTLTPRGGDYGDREGQRAGIDRVNEIIEQEALARGMHVVDISPVSDRVREDRSLVDDDGLHPSAKQYAGWVELIARSMREALDDEG